MTLPRRLRSILERTLNAATFPIKIYKRFRLKNKNFSLIAYDCTGGFLLNYLGVKFNTPTINLYFSTSDFVKFCRELEYYISISNDMKYDKETSEQKGYPVGILGTDDKEIHIFFMHYPDFDSAKSKWLERSKRINWDNLYFLMNVGDGKDNISPQEFDALPYEHKVFLTYKEHKGIKSAVKLGVNRLKRDGIGCPEVSARKRRFPLEFVIDDWDYIKFFNS